MSDPATEIITFRLTPRLAGEITREAARQGITRSAYIRRAVDRQLGQDHYDYYAKPGNQVPAGPGRKRRQHAGDPQ